MSETAWSGLAAALGDGPPLRVWVRDDDAVTVTPALERLDTLCAAAGAPLLLAVIPARAAPALGRWAGARARAHVTPCQHGFAHVNHAAAGARACELGGERSDAEVLGDLAEGRRRMDQVFGPRWTPILVPPWNRIRDSLVPHLGGQGFVGLSTFASTGPRPDGPPRLDCDLDIIDWRNGRRGRSAADCCGRLAALVPAARAADRPIGLLTHHLAHDDACWALLERLLPMLARHPGVRFTDAASALGYSASARDSAPSW